MGVEKPLYPIIPMPGGKVVVYYDRKPEPSEASGFMRTERVLIG
jgi:hypothetical protein